MLLIRSLKKKYDREGGVITILEDWSDCLRESCSYVLVGRSGVGKTTILRMLAGFESVTAGTIILRESTGTERRLNAVEISFVSQFPVLFDELNVQDNVLLAAKVAGVHLSKAKYEIQELLALLGLKQAGCQFPYQLSGGMQQRVCLAQALIRQPRFIFADEPTASLDDKSKRLVLNALLAYVQKHAIGLIMSTHDEYVAQSADVHLMLEAGRIIPCNK